MTVYTLLVSALLLHLELCAALLPAKLVYQFPNNTWVENIAVRATGDLLVTLVSSADIYSISTSKTCEAKLLHHFANFTTATGITEVAPDVFQVTVTSISTQAAISGAAALYEIDFSTHGKPKVVETLKLPDVGLPNGLVKLNKDKLLIADSVKGNIVVADLKAKTAKVAITDPLLGPSPNAPALPAVNGLKIQGDILYFTSTGQNVFGRIPIDLETGTARGPAAKIASSLPPGNGYDDFALGSNGDAYLASGSANVIERVNVFTKRQEVVSGSPDTLTFAEPTSAAFGRIGNGGTLYVTTAGGLNSPRLGVIGGQVNAISLDRAY